MNRVRARLETRAKPSRGGDAKPRDRTSQTRVSRAAWSTRSGTPDGGEGFDRSSQSATPTERLNNPMLKNIKQRMDRNEDEGFTLIELMVVLLIIAILLAIAIPTFLGARNTANARSTQENLRNALTAEQTNWTSNQVFTTDAQSLEPSLAWETTIGSLAEGAKDVYAVVGNSPTDDNVTLQAYAKDGNCYALYQSNNASTDFTAYIAYKGACDATLAAPAAKPTAAMQGTIGTSASAATTTSPNWYTSW